MIKVRFWEKVHFYFIPFLYASGGKRSHTPLEFLHIDEVLVSPAARNELLVRALLHDAPILQHANQVGILNGR